MFTVLLIAPLMHRSHHLQVAVVVDGPIAVGRLEGAVEDVKVLGRQVRGTLDRLVLVDEGDDLIGLVGGVAERLQRVRHRLVDDLQVAAADEALVLDERDVRLHPGRVAIHHEGDRAGGRQDR
jgi:hypothetical protein